MVLKIRVQAGVVYRKSLLAGVAEHTVLKSFSVKAELSVVVLWSQMLSCMNQVFSSQKIQKDHPESSSSKSHQVFFIIEALPQICPVVKIPNGSSFRCAPKVRRKKGLDSDVLASSPVTRY